MAIGVGYWYSSSLHIRVNEIWKQALWEDCDNRMRVINSKKVILFSPEALSTIEIETEKESWNFKKDSTYSVNDKESSFWSDQCYLSTRNTVKLEKLDKLFRSKLKENGYDYQTIVSYYNKDLNELIFSSPDNVSLLDDFMKLPYQVNIANSMFLEGYVKGYWIDGLLWSMDFSYLLWGTGAIFILALVILTLRNKCIKSRKSSDQSNQTDAKNEETPDKTTNLSGDSVQQEITQAIEPEETKLEETKSEEVEPEEIKSKETEQSTIPVTESAEDKTDSSLPPTEIVIYMDKRKHILFYSDKSILLSPKLFALFYQLSQGEDYFQPYDYLFQKFDGDKKQLGQLIINLRRKLKSFPGIDINVVRASGCQLEGMGNIKIRIERIDGKVANDMDEHTD